MEAAFAKAGLNSYEIEGNRIRVPRGQQSAYMGALADEGALPPDFGKYLEKAVNNDGPFVSRTKQQEMLRVAKQSELQLILSRMKGIESAAVLYDEKKLGGFVNRLVSTASVNIKPVGSQPLDEERVPMIRHLVASAFAGLKPEDVSVTDLNGRTYSSSSASGLGNAAEDPFISRKLMHEQQWERKIRKQLEYIPGVVVSTNVELARETEFEESRTTLDPKGVIFEATESTTSKTTETPTAMGRPGVVAQQPGGANQPGAVGAGPSLARTAEETSQTQTGTAIPTTITKRRQQGLTPQKVKVAVSIPTSYYVSIWDQRNPPAAGAEPAKPDAAALAEIERQVKEDVKNTVVPLLPTIDAAVDPFPQVAVTSFQSIPTAAPPVPSFQDHLLVWLSQYWSTLGMVGLAMVSLLMLRGVMKAVPNPPLAATTNLSAPSIRPAYSQAPADEFEPNEQELAAEQPVETPRARLKRRTATGPSMRDELANLVQEDPDAAVAVLRNWIGAGT
jgi:flagellar M-ring protein FliF